MKNFFKKLAFVLALAMIVTAIAPAAQASAATEPAFKYTSKKLYIGGDKTGTYGDTYRFTFTNAKGYTATWKSSKPSVATVDAKTGEIQAVAVGTATIKATLKNKAGNVVETRAKVYVKQNAEKVGFGAQAAVKDMAIGDTGKVNVYRQVGTTKVWKQSDKTLVTDVIKWTTSDAAVATVDKWGKVTAVGAGEATITATATQSEGSTAVASKSYKVTVKAGLVDAKQAGLNTIAATFAGDLSAVVNSSNVKVFQIVGTTKVNVLVKDVKFDDTDKTKATITVYNTFAKDAEYVVEYGDTKASFKGADTSAEAVASIAIKTTEVKPNEATKIEFVVYDKNGVDITSTALTDRIAVSNVGTNNDSYLDTNNKTIVFWAKDKSATIKASFNTYTYNDDYTPKTIDAQGVIVSKETVTSVTSVGTATITSGTPDFTKAKLTMSVKDQSSRIYLKTTNSAGKDVYSADGGFKFSSSDENTLLVNENGYLFPVKEGAAQVIVKYNDVVIGAVTVTIGAERKATEVTTTWNKTTLTNKLASDNVVLTVVVKDQYGDAIAVTPELSYVTGAKNVAAPAAVAVNGATGKYTVTFNGAQYDTNGSYQYKVKVDKQERYVIFTVDTATTPVSYAFSNAGSTIDTALNYYLGTDATKTADKKLEMQLSSFASNGYKVADITAAFNNKADAVAAAGTTGSAMYVEVLDKDGNPVVAGDKFITVANGKVTVNPVVASGSTSELVKLPAGNYVVKGYEVKASTTSGTTTISETVRAYANFVVTDTQKAATVKINSTNSTLGVGSYASVFVNEDVATIKIGDTVVNSQVQKVEKIGDVAATKTLSITKAIVKVPVNYNGTSTYYFLQEVVIGATITFK